MPVVRLDVPAVVIEAVSDVQGWPVKVPNPTFNPELPVGPTNLQEIPNPSPNAARLAAFEAYLKKHLREVHKAWVVNTEVERVRTVKSTEVEATPPVINVS